MSGFLDNNIKIIEEKHEEIEVNKDLVEKLSKQDVIEEISSYNGFSIRSQMNQKHAIEAWCKQFDTLKHNVMVMVFGLGSLEYYIEFRKQHPNTVIIIYEPSEEIFYNNIAVDDYSGILNSKYIVFCVGDKKKETLMLFISQFLNVTSFNTPYCAKIPNYNKMFEEEYNEYETTIIKGFESNHVSRNTLVFFWEDRIANYIDNLVRLTQESTALDIKEQFGHHEEIKDYPAIIISAGPSLDKNVKDIEDVKGRAFIICVDAAVNTLMKNDIKPDVIVSVDPNNKGDMIESSRGEHIPLIVSVYGSTALIGTNDGRKFFLTNTDTYLSELLSSIDKTIPIWARGGSVSTTSYAVAKELGFNTIILMGQDCGFPDNRLHAKAGFDDEEAIDESDGNYFYVDSVDGGKILTRRDMNIYREWFETQIKEDSNIKLVDATEGGALIKGTEVTSIVDAVRKYCPEEKIDFEMLINSSEYLLENEHNRNEVMGQINKTFDSIDDTIEYLNKAKRDYDKLGELNRKRKYNTAEFKRAYKKVTEHNNTIDNDKDLYIYGEFLGEKYFESVDKLREAYDDEYEEIKNLVEQSKIIIDEYISTAKTFKNKWLEHKSSESDE